MKYLIAILMLAGCQNIDLFSDSCKLKIKPEYTMLYHPEKGYLLRRDSDSTFLSYYYNDYNYYHNSDYQFPKVFTDTCELKAAYEHVRISSIGVNEYKPVTK